MFPPQFGYRRAGSVAEAVDLLAEFSDRDARVLAGGHGLLPDLKAGREAPDVLVDVGGVDDLRYVEAEGGATAVGALTTYADVDENERLWSRATAFAEAVSHVGDVQIRNRGTVGGNLAQADPSADPPAAALVSEATLVARGPDGRRDIDAADFFEGDGGTTLRDGELLTEVRIPAVDDGSEGSGATAGGAYHKETHPASGYALVGVAAAVVVEDGDVTDARVAVNGVTDPPRRLAPVEAALDGAPADAESVEAAADRATEDIDPGAAVSDAYASGAYRVEVLPVHVRRSLETALDRATGAAATPTRPPHRPAADDGGDRR
ncbi:xanthine dehydrogenase family protein subunit M [Halogeometricum sp. S1BR25-6]|uniref:Xanthine dehydrogenase family protein subunit M n=1 Tax=Halogeometricum salsisoli TaxID=2950536 RepID=A0ABU2GEU4_9EURY|nr:xanthine dehydrogenase family protein subunit M [Halogeometricum sp. S1BR25-6]MDS0299315.1 xanthine dehydrogenase family protein subunit M [Halogeometricum sp. S1BR25-6]